MVELLMHRFLLKKGQIIENKLTFEAMFVLNTLECMLEYIRGQFEPLRVLVEKFDVIMKAKKPIKSTDQLLKIFSLELYEIKVIMRLFKAALLEEDLEDAAVLNEESNLVEAVVTENYAFSLFKNLRCKVAHILRDMVIAGRILEKVHGRTASYLEEVDRAKTCLSKIEDASLEQSRDIVKKLMEIDLKITLEKAVLSQIYSQLPMNGCFVQTQAVIDKLHDHFSNLPGQFKDISNDDYLAQSTDRVQKLISNNTTRCFRGEFDSSELRKCSRGIMVNVADANFTNICTVEHIKYSPHEDFKIDKLQIEDVKNKLGKIYNGFQEGDLENVSMYFESGTLSKFWLYADTKALEDLQAMIQVLV